MSKKLVTFLTVRSCHRRCIKRCLIQIGQKTQKYTYGHSLLGPTQVYYRSYKHKVALERSILIGHAKEHFHAVAQESDQMYIFYATAVELGVLVGGFGGKHGLKYWQRKGSGSTLHNVQRAYETTCSVDVFNQEPITNKGGYKGYFLPNFVFTVAIPFVALRSKRSSRIGSGNRAARMCCDGYAVYQHKRQVELT